MSPSGYDFRYRLDEVAGLLDNELILYDRSINHALEAQSSEASHGAYCDRFGEPAIPGVSSTGGRQYCRRAECGDATLQLSAYLKKVTAPARVIVETCAEAFGVADQALSPSSK